MPQALQSKIQNATFPVYEDQDELVQVGSKTALRGYHLTPRKALQNVDLARNPLFFEVTSQVGNGEIPVAYIPPEDAQKPVILLSPGAAGRIADYVPFIQAVTDNGYGVMAYQYALLDEAGKHISQQGFSFKQIEARLSDDLETLSDVLAGQRPLKPDGRHQPVWLDVPYNRQVLAGHSTGGFLSANLLAYDPHVGKPERPYRALVLLATPPTFEVAFKNVLGRSQLGDKQLQKAEKPRTLSLVRNAFNLDGFAPFDVTPSLSGVSQEIPTLFIQGQKDDLVRDTIWKRCQDHRDGFYSVDYFCLPGANHSNLLGGDYGQQVAKQLDAFLEESLERSRGYGWSA